MIHLDRGQKIRVKISIGLEKSTVTIPQQNRPDEDNVFFFFPRVRLSGAANLSSVDITESAGLVSLVKLAARLMRAASASSILLIRGRPEGSEGGEERVRKEG